MATRKFNNIKTAISFKKRVNGKLINVKKDKLEVNCNYIVSYTHASQLSKEDRKLRKEEAINRDVMGVSYSNYLASKQKSGDFSEFN